MIPSDASKDTNLWYCVEEGEIKLGVTGKGKRVGIFCGSTSECRDLFKSAAHRLGMELANSGCSLVYGGGGLGIMGEVAKSCYDNRMENILAVLPNFMMGSVYTKTDSGWGQVLVVPDMSARKTQIARNSDVFIVLPGGFGTLDEMSEMLTWNQIGYQNKILGILNTNGFFDGILQWIDNATHEGFIKEIFLKNVYVSKNPAELVQMLLAATPVDISGKFFTKA